MTPIRILQFLNCVLGEGAHHPPMANGRKPYQKQTKRHPLRASVRGPKPSSPAPPSVPKPRKPATQSVKNWTRERHKVRSQTDPEYVAKRRLYATAYNKTAGSKLARLRTRASRLGIAFDLDLEFFENVPSSCPQCGIEMVAGTKHPGTRSPSVDRTHPAIGYVHGNCEWICMGCNMQKRDLTWEQLRDFAQRGIDRTKSDPMFIGEVKSK